MNKAIKILLEIINAKKLIFKEKNSYQECQILEAFEEKIKRIFMNDESEIFCMAHRIDFELLDGVLADSRFNYSQKCFVSAKLLEQNFAILNTEGIATVDYYGLYENSICQKYDQHTLEKLISIYLQNPDSELIENDLKKLMACYVSKNDKKSLTIRKYYEKLKSFTEKERTELDYVEAKNNLQNLNIPDSISEYCLGYYKLQAKKVSKEKQNYQTIPKKIVSSPITKPSKKELKRQLDAIYNPNSEEPFDYINYRELLKILKNLNYADSVVENILSGCNQNYVQNYSFYQLTYTRMLCYVKDKEALEELKYYLQSMFICSDEDYECAKTEVIKILDKHAGYMAQSFNYEMELMRKM